MSGITGYVSERFRPDLSHGYFGAIDLLNSGNCRSFRDSGSGLSVCVPDRSFLGQRYIEHDDYVVATAGHVVSDRALDWPSIVSALRAGRFDYLNDLTGRFALAILDTARRQVFLVTDRIGQYPFYALTRSDGIFWSTSQASFSRLDDAPDISERWLHEYFLCNFSPTHTSFLQGVEKLPAASVTAIDMDSRRVIQQQYADAFRATRSPYTSDEELEIATEVFASRVPRYLSADEQAISGVTSGFDSRVIIANVIDTHRLATYTYGIPGCADLTAAMELTKRLGLRHSIVNLDGDFEQRLPDLMLETVWLSSGLQSCIRSSLAYAYRSVHRLEPDCRVLLTGSSGDQLFRGGGIVPYIVSKMIESIFKTGKLPTGISDTVSSIFVSPAQALSHMDDVRGRLTDSYGDPTLSSAHLAYLTYEVPSEYFAGEGALAEHYFDYRTPFCDREILKLAWSFRLGTLGNSRFLPKRTPSRRKNRLHARLIASNPKLAGLPIQGRPLRAYARNHAALYYAWAAALRLRKRFTRRSPAIPLEDWQRWFAGPLRERIASLLGDTSHLREYVRQDYVDRCLSSGDERPLNKLVTSEIILRLSRNGWNINSI